MRTFAHISDLHFGRELRSVAEGLLDDLKAQKPDLVIVSGDFTQRARTAQFRAAQAFLARLSAPWLAVPGNHDIPLFDVARRFLAPLTRYRRHIAAAVNPVFQDSELLVIGINTARSFTWKNGRISNAQREHLRHHLESAGERVKVVVTHHPFLPPPGDVGIDLVGGAADAIHVLERGRVDLLLAGHLHHGYAGDIRTQYPTSRRAIIAVQAGTAISCRTRGGEANAYNLIRAERAQISIAVRAWNGTAFSLRSQADYALQANGWHPRATDDPGTIV